MLRLSLILIVWLGVAANAQAQVFVRATAEPVTLCAAIPGVQAPPDFTASDCQSMTFWDLDPQGRHFWAEATFELTQQQIDTPGPLGVFVSGMASSRVFLNGAFIGANGEPAPTRQAETPGRMDAVIYAPQSLLQVGENRLAIELSGHHTIITLSAPLHVLGVGPYLPPTARILQAYWPSLIMMSVFALSALVFGVLAARSEDREGPAILAALSLFLGLMLLSETARGLFAYAYPLHAWRLIAITVFGCAVGIALTAHLLHRFSGLKLKLRLGATALAAGLIILPTQLADGFDAKTGYALAIAFSLGAAACFYWAFKQKAGAAAYAIGLIGAVILLSLTGHLFLDLHLYWLSAAFLFALFIRQALALVRERQERQHEAERANRLDAALAQARQASQPAQLKLVSAGRTEFVATEDILSLSGAGDYVELRFKSGRTALHNATLTELEKALPDAFLRVHRSCIVNTGHVESLEREAGGGGRLVLTGGAQAPVSRRIMPKVKTTLEAGAD